MPDDLVSAPPVSRWHAARRMIGIAWHADHRRTLVTFVLLVVDAVAVALFAFWLKLLVDGVGREDRAAVIGAAIAIGSSIAVSALLDYLMSRVRMELNDRTHHLIEKRMMHLVGGTATLEIHETPEHLTQLELLQEESWHFGSVIPSLLGLLNTIIRASLTAVLLVAVHPLLLLLPLCAIPMLIMSPRTNNLFALGQEMSAEHIRRSRSLYELSLSTAAAKEVRLFRLRDAILARFHEAETEMRRIQQRLNIQGQLIRLATRLVFVAGYLGAILFVINRAVAGAATTGDVLLAAVLSGQVLALVAGSAELVQWTLRTLTAAGRFVYLEELAHRIRNADSMVMTPDRLRRGIELRDVGFRYAGAESATLRDVNVLLPAGATVAIVGDNGAGKSTLVKLLGGMYPPTEGSIWIDDVELADLDADRWRERVSAGFQDHARFEFSVREAVGLGSLPEIEDASAVKSAIERGGAADVLPALPAGLDTQLGPNWTDGVDLSGGQWQKLAIGRAMMRRHPLLLLLDEPTAALDAESEHRLFERWTAAAQDLRRESGAITVLVSHRFSTVRMADLIVVVDGGTVTEIGSHEELMRSAGLYAELFELQARAYR